MELDYAQLGDDAWNWLSAHLPSIVGVLVALVIAWIIAGVAKRTVVRALSRTSFDATLTKFFANVLRYLIIVAAVLGCLGVFGVDTTSFAAVIGAAGLAIGLAFQGTLSNFAAGVMLLTFRPFKVDDFVDIAGSMGTVVEIELFTTELKTLSNEKLVIPNSSIFGAVIKNYSFHPFRRCAVDVGCDYGADIDETRRVLEEALAGLEHALEEPPPQVFLKGLGGSSVDWQLRAWANQEVYWDLHQEMVRAAKVALDGAGIGIPFPQMDVHLDGKLDRD